MKLHMTFRNIRVNTDKRMIAGAFYSVYNPNAPSIINAGQTVSQAVDLTGEIVNDLKGVTRLISDFIAESETQPHTGTQIDSIQHIMNSKKEAILNNIQSQFGMEARQKADSAFQQINEGFECDKEQLDNPQPEAAPEKTGPNEPSATAKKDCNAFKKGGLVALDNIQSGLNSIGNPVCGCSSDPANKNSSAGDCQKIIDLLNAIKASYQKNGLFNLNAPFSKLNDIISINNYFSCKQLEMLDNDPVNFNIRQFDPKSHTIENNADEKYYSMKIEGNALGDKPIEIRSYYDNSTIGKTNENSEQVMDALDKWLFGGEDQAVNITNTTTNKITIYTDKVSKEFLAKIENISAELEFDPNYLMACMAFETGETFDPCIKSPVSSATGLIQFMSSTAKHLGTTTEELCKMSDLEQLDYVRKYFLPYKGKIHSIADVYMVIFCPKAVGKDMNYTLYPPTDDQYKANSGLDKDADARISKQEAYNAVKRKLEKGFNQSKI
jgi:hypothetical protein